MMFKTAQSIIMLFYKALSIFFVYTEPLINKNLILVVFESAENKFKQLKAAKRPKKKPAFPKRLDATHLYIKLNSRSRISPNVQMRFTY